MITQFELIFGIAAAAITFLVSLYIILKQVAKINPRFVLPLFLVLTVWFVLIFILGANRVFRPEKPSPLPVGLAIFLPVILGSFVLIKSESLQKVLLNIPHEIWTVLHIARYVGSLFIWFHLNGKLPPTFAFTAGLGDSFVATLAPLVLLAIKRDKNKNPTRILWIFNLLGILDFTTAVTLGTLSSDGPQRLIFETPTSSLIGDLPLILIPGFGVPFIALVHVISIMKLRRGLP
ncbi:hypothetical protein [Leptospira stimsonii]|uniref:Uncharacterized protein n=1 Tax=Leptospira stimsonii TaxID=2202203 RepID=A0A4R9L7Z3_9LEPT|nr:hypothetical protein [Leptospira stimsonii]RHX83865.1 hypothetical protein DLM78_20510 [Leptospira stimsonii]TGK18405.1 hypothetical protein EHO98_12380 [Leptospira stimsonii]TGM21955.1 hypothetical protein EHQ90_02145 [Leptospira stimsonii]